MGLLDYFEVSQGRKEEVYVELVRESKPSVDFFIMVALSAVIVTFGLLANNIAVIIGAMLIAPLMYPLIAISLSMILGEFTLLRRSISGEAKGVLLTVGVSWLVAVLTPGAGITSEILLRTRPTLVDLTLALAAGAAAAYAIVRKLNPSLPGVAIAVAILPPLSVVGIALALKNTDLVLGAVLLFLANVLAIHIASFLVFWLFRFIPGRVHTEQEERAVLARLRYSALMLLVVLVPLGFIMYNSVTELTVSQQVEHVLSDQLLEGKVEELMSYDVDRTTSPLAVTAVIRSHDGLSGEKLKDTERRLASNLGLPVSLTVHVIPIQSYTS